MRWGLGADSCVFYSQPFAVAKHSIILHGFQEVVDEKRPICYSLVKQNGWGKRQEFAQVFLYGDYQKSKSFQIPMENIPIGDHYQIEVFNGFNMSCGQFQVK